MEEHLMNKNIALATAAVVMSLAGTQGALADSRGYVVANWAPAMNNKDDSGCPQGRNAAAQELMQYTLKQEGMPQDQIDKLTAPDKMTNQSYGAATAMRGREDGKPVNVYTHPLTVPDPHIKLDQSPEGFGFNLDGKTTPLDYTDPLTHETGVDNRAARVFGCFDRTRGTYEAPPGNWSFRWTHYTEGNSWLIEVKNKGDHPLNFQNEDNVTISFYRGLQLPFRNGSGYEKDMTYTIDPDARLKQFTSFKGKIRNGTFIGDVTPEFRMIASSRINPVFDFKSVHTRFTFKPDGSLEGFVGGYVPLKMVYFPFGDYGIAAEYIGGMDTAGLWRALQTNADTDIDADPKTHLRTRISQTYQVEATPAFLIRTTDLTSNAK
jgi:hypothetical protein